MWFYVRNLISLAAIYFVIVPGLIDWPNNDIANFLGYAIALASLFLIRHTLERLFDDVQEYRYQRTLRK